MLGGKLHGLDGQHLPVGRWALRAAFALAALLAGLAVTEASYRQHEFRDWVYDPDLLYVRPDGWKGPGWSNDLRPPKRRAGEPLVVCVGDSVTEGLGVAPDQAWPSLLAETLGLRPEQVRNLGVTGWDPDQVATLLETRLGEWHPDAVVWGTYANDIFPTQLVYDTEDRAARWVAREPPATAGVLPGPLARWLIPRSALYRVFLASRYARSEAAHLLAPGGREWYAAQLARVARWSATTRVPVVVIAIPPHVLTGPCGHGICRTVRGWYDEITGALGGQAALPWVDGLAALDGTGPYYLPGSKDIDHPNAAGHAKLAEIVAPLAREALASGDGREARVRRDSDEGEREPGTGDFAVTPLVAMPPGLDGL